MQNAVPHVSTVTPRDDLAHHTALTLVKRISWPAIIAGAVIALAIQVLLAMLGTGIGASTVDPLANGDSPSAGAFGIGAAIWWGVSSLIALFFGGWMAGRLSGMPRSADGGLHGLLTWAVSLLATVYLVSSAASSVMSGAAGILGTAATATATVGAAAAPKIADAAGDQMSKAGISVDSLKREAMQLLSQTGKPGLQPGAVAQQAAAAVSDVKQNAGNPVANDQDFSSLIERLLKSGKDTVSQVDKDAVINVVVARTGLSREEATKRVDGWMNTADQARVKAAQVADQAKQKAREVADATAKGVSRAMLLGFLALALGALVAFWGGSMGQRREAAVVLPV
jgi:hypothetical protein